MNLVEVRVRDCSCPETVHGEEGDLVFLTPVLGMEGGVAAELDMEAAQRISTTEQAFSDALRLRWTITFTRYGAIGWNWLDENGPVPFDVEALVRDWTLARPVAEKANELYFDSVFAPFRARLAGTSPNGRTAHSTSRRGQPTSSRTRSSRATSGGSRKSRR